MTSVIQIQGFQANMGSFSTQWDGNGLFPRLQTAPPWGASTEGLKLPELQFLALRSFLLGSSAHNGGNEVSRSLGANCDIPWTRIPVTQLESTRSLQNQRSHSKIRALMKAH